MTPTRPSVLCVDDDRDVVEVVQAILEDEGYAVSSGRPDRRRAPADHRAARAGCVLLDGFAAASYGDAWIWLPGFGTGHARYR